jgi:hypothetical protein
MRHPDFEKIYRAFMVRYGKNPAPNPEGEAAYRDWLSKLNLDETKPYGQSQRRAERFSWIEPHITYIREDEAAKYYKVEALFPLTSMNGNTYTREELAAATRTMIGKANNLNHTDEFLDIEIVDAQFEDDIVELLVRVPKNAACQYGRLCDLIDNAEVEEHGIVHVSIEAGSTRGVDPSGEGVKINGLLFTGLGWLTKDVLPGVPLTRILPVEKLVEAYAAEKTETDSNSPQGDKMKDKKETKEATCPKCGAPLDENGVCTNKDCPESKKKPEESKKDDESGESKNPNEAFEVFKKELLEQVTKLEAKIQEMTSKEVDFARDYADLKTKVATLDAQVNKHTSEPEPKPEEKPKENPESDADKTDTASPSPEPPAATSALDTQPAQEAKESTLEEIDVLTAEGHRRRIEQLIKEGATRAEAVAITNMEVFEAISKPNRSK